MLSCALKFLEVFIQYKDDNENYNLCPSDENWKKLTNFVVSWKSFDPRQQNANVGVFIF